MKIYILRHAKSSWENYNDDHDRPLSERGISDAKTLGLYLNKKNISFNSTLCSTSLRTRETLTICKKNSPESFIKIDYRKDLYHCSAQLMLDILIKSKEESILLIGHNPGISELISRLSNLYNIDYPTCVFASFRLLNDTLENGVKTLSIVRPKNKKIIKLL